MHAVPLPAGEVADPLLLIASLEVEAGAVGPAVDLAVADLHVLDAAGDLDVDAYTDAELLDIAALTPVLLFGAQRAMIVDLAVHHDHVAGGGVDHRLRAGRRKIDDREPGIA